MMSVIVRFGTYPGAHPKLSWLPLSQQEEPNCWILSQSFGYTTERYRLFRSYSLPVEWGPISACHVLFRL